MTIWKQDLNAKDWQFICDLAGVDTEQQDVLFITEYNYEDFTPIKNNGHLIDGVEFREEF